MEKSLLTYEVLQDPFDNYRIMREKHPVYWDQSSQVWIVLGYEEACQILASPLVSADRRFMSYKYFEGIAEESFKDYKKVMENNLMFLDAPRHLPIRKLAIPLFTAKAIEKWERVIQGVFDDLLAPLAAKETPIDFATEVANHFPSEVIYRFFAMPEEKNDDFRPAMHKLSVMVGKPVNEDTPIEQLAREANKAAAISFSYIRNIVEERMQKPGDDMISEVVKAGKGIATTDELVCLIMFLISAGYVTTTDLLCNTIFHLLDHRDQWELLVQNPQLIDSAIEEVMRYNANVPFTIRIATEDLQIGDITIPKGGVAAIGLAAANRDPRRWENPDIFDIQRKPQHNLIFAHGAHLCIGQYLARLEIKIALTTLLKRFPDMKLDNKQTSKVKAETLMFRGFFSLPIQMS